MTILTVPSRAAFTLANGRLTPEAEKFLNGIVVRLGGSVAGSITDLAVSDDDDSGLEEFKAEAAKAMTALQLQPVYVAQEVQALLTEMNGLREQVALLAQQINDMQQGSTYGRDR